MESGGKKVLKPQKTKFRKNKDHENFNLFKQKQRNKEAYRLLKNQEKEEYVI